MHLYVTSRSKHIVLSGAALIVAGAAQLAEAKGARISAPFTMETPRLEMPALAVPQSTAVDLPRPPVIKTQATVPFRCYCGVFGLLEDRRLATHEGAQAPEPGDALLTAFSSGRYVELWRLENFRNPSAESWAGLQYRDKIIAAFSRSNDVMFAGRLLKTLLPALASADTSADPWNAPPGEITTLDSRIKALRFAPDFVVTVAAREPVRLEVEFSPRIVLVQTSSKWGFFELGRSDLAELQILAESLTLPDNPSLVPKLALTAIGR